MSKRNSATLEQVAALAGVSRATASRAINDSPRVSQRSREAVQEAIEKLGYVPNWAARSLVTRRTESIALVFGEPDTRLFPDPVLAGLVRGISERLAGTEFQLVILLPHGLGRSAPLAHYLDNGHVDGVLFSSLHGEDSLPLKLAERGMPVVVNGRPTDAPVSYVDVDNLGGAHAAVEHLLDRGRRRIAEIRGPIDMGAAVDRHDGYRRALAEARIKVDPSLVAIGEFTAGGADAAMRSLLERRPDLDAVFAASDTMALSALKVLHDQGRRVPEDVAVVGFDDTERAPEADPPLTTVRQPVTRMGHAMAERMLQMITTGDTSPRTTVFDTELIVRSST
ncbi:MAG TPA: LacI family DNA-binding transcriptional regulator [Egibacteraceae bacterium]|nr:LacI family DNA-binding transcriptional regulator [Egibacteraceae bacterium]